MLIVGAVGPVATCVSKSRADLFKTMCCAIVVIRLVKIADALRSILFNDRDGNGFLTTLRCAGCIALHEACAALGTLASLPRPS